MLTTLTRRLPLFSAALLVLLLSAVLPAQAQSPTVVRSSLAPAANARTAPVGTVVGVRFSQPIKTSTAGNIKVFSEQYRGQRTATVAVSGNTVTLTPTAGSGSAGFKPGETVRVTVPATVQSTANVAATKYVYQFTVAATGGYSTFVVPASNASPTVGSGPVSVAVGDVDGDGDLDLLAANANSGTVSVRLNDGMGNFTPPVSNPNPAVESRPFGVAVGDVDGDGDLDLLTANSGSGTVSVRLNDGTGSFTPPASNPNPAVGSNLISVAVGDVDSDGDLDLLTANFFGGTVSVRLNDGSGNFTAPASNPDPAVDSRPVSVALGDVDGDGDLDLLTANSGSGTVSVRLNDGTGNFTAPASNPDPAVGSRPYSVALGDVDGDGDLDLLAANSGSGTVSVRLNDGTGSFTPPASNPNPAVGSGPQSVAVGDVDGDGDLDLLAANANSGTMSVRLNQPPPPTLTGITPVSGPAGTVLSLTGTNLTGATAVTFTGSAGQKIVTTGFSVNGAATGITGVVVPAGAQSGPVTVTTPNGTSLTGPVRFWRTATVAAGFGHTLGLRPDGTLWAWGTGTNGQLGTGSTATANPTPAPVGAASTWASVAAGLFHTVALRQNGTLWAWGDNSSGQLGNSSATPTVPVQVGPTTNWVSMAAGNFHTVAVRTDGTLWAWGDNGSGQLGTGTGANSPAPVQVGTGTSWVSVAAGGSHTLAVQANGTLWAWGGNGSGQLGNSSATPTVPVQVGSATSWVSVAAGNTHSLAVRADGTLWAWGDNYYGQLGLGSSGGGTNASAPVQVGTATTWASAAAGNHHSAALQANGSLWSWGANDQGHLGLGNTTDQATPQRVGTGTDWTSIATGQAHTAGERSCRAVWAGGYNFFGQVGDGSTTQRNTPVLALSPVRLLSFSPASAEAGTSVAVTGTGLAGLTALSVNGANALPSVTNMTDTGFTFVVPTTATATGLVSVAASCGPASSAAFTVPLPTLTGASPTSGVAGTSVVLTGTGLATATALTVNGVTTPIASATATSLAFTVPTGAGAAQQIIVTTPAGPSAAFTGFAVRLQVRSTAPVANALTAPLANSALALTFSEPVTAASAATVRVFSAQAGGRKAGTMAVSGSTASYASTLAPVQRDFRPGEVVSVSVPATVQGAGGLAAQKKVYQFTTAVGGTGRGNFLPPNQGPYGIVMVGRHPNSVVVGDVDGDGDLDLLTANASDAAVSVRLNGGDASGTNTGVFAAPAIAANGTVSVGSGPLELTLGDVDGDGDLDLLTANASDAAVSVRLNGGDATGTNTGVFAAPAIAANGTVSVGSGPASVVVGDVDGDGDLDLLTANQNDNTVSVRLNGGDASGTNTGVFAAPAIAANGTVSVGSGPYSVTLGDVDGDGDLDLLTANRTASTVSVRLNGGDASGTNTGVFAAPAIAANGTVSVGSSPNSVVVGDVDGDGDLDLLTPNSYASTVSVRLNGGDATGTNTGVFAAPAIAANGTVSVGNGPASVALGDVDGDGDLDLLTANQDANTMSVRLNGGNATGTNTGVFAAPAIAANGTVNSVNFPVSMALGDVDGDGDLDLLAANYNSATVSVRLNQPPVPTLTGLSPAAELPGMPVTLTGTGFVPGTAVTFGGVAASSVSYGSPTTLTAVVPVGAVAGGSAVAVATPGGAASLPATAFEVLQVYRSAAASGCLSTDPISLSGSGGAGVWRYLRLPGAGGAVVAAIEDTRNLGTVTAGLQALGTGTSAPVRRDGQANRAYLDRNFYLTASTPAFAGQTVRVRFFGLSSELTRLHAVDGNATLAGLNASQYDGANVNCALADNDPAGQRRLLAAPATVAPGADWFTAQLTVADHFSEFYLTGASTPLPVELLSFTAQAQGRAVALAWRTASEKNSAYFAVERSVDGASFEQLGQVAAQGTTARPTDYTYLDDQLPSSPASQLTYYRLRQVDQDGTANYSPVRSVSFTQSLSHSIKLWPNPARTAVAVSGLAAGASVQVLDALGRVVATGAADGAGAAHLALPAGLAAGVYVVRSGSQAQRLAVE